MITRYGARNILLTGAGTTYKDIIGRRNLRFVGHYSTPDMDFPSPQEIANLKTISHVWKEGDRLWKLAAQHYDGKAHLWWVIAWFNQTPTESHLKIGDIVYIPTPLRKVLNYLDV